MERANLLTASIALEIDVASEIDQSHLMNHQLCAFGLVITVGILTFDIQHLNQQVDHQSLFPNNLKGLYKYVQQCHLAIQ